MILYIPTTAIIYMKNERKESGVIDTINTLALWNKILLDGWLFGFNTVCSIDAIPFKYKADQFKEDMIRRELNKVKATINEINESQMSFSFKQLMFFQIKWTWLF